MEDGKQWQLVGLNAARDYVSASARGEQAVSIRYMPWASLEPYPLEMVWNPSL